MVVVGIRFKKAGKTYYFDPGELTIERGDQVVVETSRGLEFGNVIIANRELSDDKIIYPLKPVLRMATQEDKDSHSNNKKKEVEAFDVCQKKIKEHSLEMNLIDVEFTFDNNKVIFYFTADGRVDFRDLVKDLASIFRTRIELRQIGVRDEAKLLNGIGPCGKELCCSNWMGDFTPVSIKMAKDQNLSLNPTKISGVCSRLMCCLNFEHETYLYYKKDMPDVGDKVKIGNQTGEVLDVNILKGVVFIRSRVNDADVLNWYPKEELKIIEKTNRRNEVVDLGEIE
jgi:cell fate regulator YaaT (PSP1 superfamily)